MLPQITQRQLPAVSFPVIRSLWMLLYDVIIISVDFYYLASFNFSPNSNKTSVCKSFQFVKADIAEMMVMSYDIVEVRRTFNVSKDLATYFFRVN